MKSPFKFLDSYTKDDREIFFVWLSTIFESWGSKLNPISPLQGLYPSTLLGWTITIAPEFRAYSAESQFQNRPAGTKSIKTGHRPVLQNYTIASPVGAQ